MSNNTKNIKIKDFDLFVEALKYTARNYASAQLLISKDGLNINSKKELITRAELKTNAISCDEDIEIFIESLSSFNKIIDTIKTVHNGDYSELNMGFTGTFITFNSKKFKTKYATQKLKEDLMTYVGSQFKRDEGGNTLFQPVLGFTTSSSAIKMIMNHSFIFKDTSEARVYISPDKEMENNVLYATIGNKTDELYNSITLKFGLINYGAFERDSVTMDFDRLNFINTIPSEDIKVEMMKQGCFVSSTTKMGKDDTFLSLILMVSFRKDDVQ